jgi:hypothetical protein
VRLVHNLTIHNGQDCEDRVLEQFESYKKALGARYPKVQVLLKGTQVGLVPGAEALSDLTTATELPPWQV